MSHPMDDHWAGRRAESDRRWERVREMQKRLAATPIAKFTADYTLAICIVMHPGILADAGRERHVEDALDKLEAFYRAEDAEARGIDPRYADGRAPDAPRPKKPRQFRRKRTRI